MFPLAFTFKINVNNYFDLDFGGNAHLMISSIAFPPKRNGACVTMTRSVEIFELLVTWGTSKNSHSFQQVLFLGFDFCSWVNLIC